MHLGGSTDQLSKLVEDVMKQQTALETKAKNEHAVIEANMALLKTTLLLQEKAMAEQKAQLAAARAEIELLKKRVTLSLVYFSNQHFKYTDTTCNSIAWYITQ